MRSIIRLPMLLIWLTALWVVLWDDLTFGNLLSGLAVAVGVLVVARPTGVTGLERSYFRPIAAIHYALYFLVQLVKSNLIVAWEIATPGSNLNRAIISVPMHTTSAGVVTLVANSVTLTPGTVTIDVDEQVGADGVVDRTLYIHVLQLGDVPEVLGGVLRLEQLAVRAFGPPSERGVVDEALAALCEEDR